MKPTALFVIRSLEIGGAEKQLQLLVEQLHGHTHCCHVYSLEAGGSLKKWFESQGVAVFSGGLRKEHMAKAPWKVALAEWRLLRLVLALNPSVIHCFLPLITFMGSLAGRIARVPLVVTSRRALGTHQRRHPVLKPLDHMAARLSHRITVNSNAVWKDMVRCDHVNESKLLLIYNGVDTRLFTEALSCGKDTRQELGLKKTTKVVIVIANLIPYKGHSDLLRAAKEIVERFPDVVFLLVGEDRGIQRTLEQDAAKLGIAQSVRFLGQQDNIPKLLTVSDVSALPSHEEGFSNVILESMAAGLPVVATNVGGNGEAVLDGITGWLIPPEDPKALAAKIIDLLIDPKKATKWGKRGRERVNRMFTVKKMAAAHIDLYGDHNLLKNAHSNSI
ncbi:MAG: glycosyltransferase [Nitrospina sp.]|jgi:glycosyltransferase involved in cell wall biosynthesis|nr:glycosyltransferase [Nitrospina sp.]